MNQAKAFTGFGFSEFVSKSLFSEFALYQENRAHFQRAFSVEFNIMSEKPFSGFVSAVLSEQTSLKASNDGAFTAPNTGRFARIFLLSRTESVFSKKQDKKIKRKVGAAKRKKSGANRKHISFEDTIIHDDVEYQVNSKPTGIYTPMMHRVIRELNIAIELWVRVLVVRIDLHQHRYTENSKTVSWFFKNMVAKLKPRYGLSQVGYFWVREQERAKSQHYHAWLFLDGDKVKHSSKVIEMAKSIWVEDWAGNHHIPTTKKPFKFVDNELKRHETVFWLSYGCKGRGKGYRPSQSKDYSTSRLKVKKAA